MGKAVKPQVHSAGLPTETPALSTNPGQEKLWEAAFPQGGDPALLDPALLPGQGGAGKGKQGAKCPEGDEQVLGSSLPCRSFSLHC